MIAFHGNQQIKDKYLNRIRKHKKLDQIIHGTYWENGKGCAVGCTIHSGDHSKYETLLGIPQVLARLEDGIFESLENGRAKDWPEQFLSAINVGSDLSLVWPKFASWMLADDKYGVLQFANTSESKKSIKDIANAYNLWVSKGEKPEIDWKKLIDAAAYAADAAAYAAYATYAAAYAAAYAADATYAAYAADATYAAAYAAYAADATYAGKYSEWRNAQADKLLELLSNTVASEVLA